MDWRRPWPRPAADALLWLVITAPVFLPDADDDAAPLGLRIAAVPLLAVAVAAGRRWPLLAAAIPPVLGLAATPELYTSSFLIPMIVLSFLLGRRLAGWRPALVFFGAMGAAGLALVPVLPGATLPGWIVLVDQVLLSMMLPWAVGRYARQHAELARTGWELAERLEREQDLIGERARLRERSRIAGDMHDSLGHELSLIALRIAALQVNPGLDGPARQAAGELRAATAHATERLREIIGVLREDGEAAPVLPAGESIAALVERVAATGLAVSVAGELPALPEMADRAAYRVVQEALTNATKHAPGAAVAVGLGRDGGDAVITVTNPAPPAPRGAGGNGIVGLDERVRLAGGTLRTGPVEGAGFAVVARLPLAPGAPATPPAARRQHSMARHRVRRSLADTIGVFAATAAVLLLLSLANDHLG
jgi:signal transduction histidine kinase